MEGPLSFRSLALAFCALLRLAHSKGCFSLDTPVTLADGSLKAIGQVHVGDVVLSWDATHHVASQAKVLQVPRFRRQNMISLELQNGKMIQSTSDHPFWSHRLQRIVSRDPSTTSKDYGLDTSWMHESDDFSDEYGKPVQVRVRSNATYEGLRGRRLHSDVATLCLDQHHWFFVHGVRTHNKGCFALDTPVTLADGSLKAIGQMQVGDVVRSWDTANNVQSHARVLGVPTFWRRNLLSLQLPSGDRIRSTSDHPFWSLRSKQIVSRDPMTTSQDYGLKTVHMQDDDIFQNESGMPVPIRVNATMSRFLSTQADVQVATLCLDQHHWFFVHGVRTHNKGCFVPETPVTLADGTSRAISQIREGDVVRSWDDARNMQSEARVLQVPSVWRWDIVSLELKAGNRIRATSDHPFWSLRAGQIVSRDPTTTSQNYGLTTMWMEDNDIFEDEYGRPVHVRVNTTHSGKTFMSSRSLEVNESYTEVMTLSLDQHHWFYVHGIRTHNKGGGGGSFGGGGHHSSCTGDDCGCKGAGCVVVVVLCVVVAVGFAAFCFFRGVGNSEAHSEVKQRSDVREALMQDRPAAGYWDAGAGQANASEDERSGVVPPSGPWSGTFSEKGFAGSFKGEKVASYNLSFDRSGRMTGTGYDTDGTCDVNGGYSLPQSKVAWRETYNWGAVEVTGTISITGSEASIQASFISTLNISGSILIKAQNFKAGARESAKAELYGKPTESVNVYGPPELERHPSWGSKHKPGLAGRVGQQAKYGIERTFSGKKLGMRLENHRQQADGRLGESKFNLNAASTKTVGRGSKVAPDPNDGLPPGWKATPDTTYHTGAYYYYHETTGQTTWTRPTK